MSFENTVGKGEIARNEQFLLFPQCFLLIWRTFCHFYQIWNCLGIVVCKLFNLEESKILSSGKGLNKLKGNCVLQLTIS